jgi:hypothetical protein
VLISLIRATTIEKEKKMVVAVYREALIQSTGNSKTTLI